MLEFFEIRLPSGRHHSATRRRISVVTEVELERR